MEKDYNFVAHTTSVDAKVLSEQIKILHKNLLASVPANFICAAVAFVGLHNNVSNHMINIWFFAVGVVSIFRLIAYYFYYRSHNSHDALHLKIFIIGMTFSAALWGLAGSILMPSNPFEQMIVIVIIAGVSAGGVQTLNANLTASIIYNSVIIFPLCVWLFSQSNSSYSYQLLGAALLTYLLFMLATSVRGHKLLLQALTLQYENLELFEKLAVSNSKLLHSYKMLEDHENKIIMINKMNEMLQACQRLDEAYEVIYLTAKKLFLDYSGSLIIFNSMTNLFEVKIEWGDEKFLISPFTVEDCWALRKGNKYLVNDPTKDLMCNHFTATPKTYLCLPLISQNHVTGLLVICSVLNDSVIEEQLQLATTFCEVLQLSLTNIKLRESLYDQSTHDALTGLFNRRYLDEELTRELQKIDREKNVLCVAMIDLDHFKLFNDTNGHEAGDEILTFMGGLLKENFRGSDIACRLGGEEFLIVFPNYTLSNAINRLQEICEIVKQAKIYFRGKVLPQITISVGVAEAPRHGRKAKDIIRAADEALYAAKRQGRDKIINYDDIREKSDLTV